MQLENQTDHVAMLALMMTGVLIKSLQEGGQLDDAAAQQLRRLVAGVRTHARNAGLTDLNILFDNVDHALGERVPAEEEPDQHLDAKSNIVWR